MTTQMAALGLTVTQSIRDGVRIIMSGVPCPTCGRTPPATMTLRDVANETHVSTATLSRFLNGRAISSDHVDQLYEWVNERLPR